MTTVNGPEREVMNDRIINFAEIPESLTLSFHARTAGNRLHSVRFITIIIIKATTKHARAARSGGALCMV